MTLDQCIENSSDLASLLSVWKNQSSSNSSSVYYSSLNFQMNEIGCDYGQERLSTVAVLFKS